MADEKGTGKHLHKSTEEPYPHHEAPSTRGESDSRSQQHASGSEHRSSSGSSQGGPTSETRDLKEREYRDKDGNIHHHTHTSEEMKDKKAS